MSAKDCAVKLLARCDRSEHEIREKLAKKGFCEEDIEDAVSFCREYGYIDDERFARHFVHDAAEIKKFGKVRIKAELKRRGVAEGIILSSLGGIDGEYETLVSEVQRRFAGADLTDMKVKNRIFGYFARRGFKTEDILRAMKESGVDDDEYFE